jgi:hypothetical protein
LADWETEVVSQSNEPDAYRSVVLPLKLGHRSLVLEERLTVVGPVGFHRARASFHRLYASSRSVFPGTCRNTGRFSPALRSLCLVVRRGIDLGKGSPSSANLLEDLGGGLVPHEKLRVVVPVLGPQLDRIDQFSHAGERTPPQATVGELFEPALD